ncbi:hypothetical protein HanXRQr2_Chr15g0674241 [Helianthus annuus]|uniref:Uncharacterized protein n=1 Tax=Helianthus annuus TaxID=4232 RepID=A0A9K3H0P3_HELAN|nr:hypothetical protein HanXRQr2_Chr15g0674241 [Helianthus annuus]KAJ0829726.1 hypothetical protein HanPSC8_Chr15g0647111 [Helianthus annuus]
MCFWLCILPESVLAIVVWYFLILTVYLVCCLFVMKSFLICCLCLCCSTSRNLMSCSLSELGFWLKFLVFG